MKSVFRIASHVFVAFSILTTIAPSLGAAPSELCTFLEPLQDFYASGARGHAQASLSPEASSFSIVASNLTPNATYIFRGTYTPRLTVVANRRGIARVLYTQPLQAGARPLTFDPRLGSFELGQNDKTVLAWGFTSVLNPDRLQRTQLRPVSATNGSASASFWTGNGQNVGPRLTLSLTNVPDGNWMLYVNGMKRGDIVVSQGAFAAYWDHNWVLSAPGAYLEWVHGGYIMFSGRMEAQIPGLNVAMPSVESYYIPSTGLEPRASARARVRFDSRAALSFYVDVEKLPPDVYEVRSGNALLGTMIVTEAGTAELAFTSKPDSYLSGPDDEDARFLPYLKRQAIFTISAGTNVYFQGLLTFPAYYVPPHQPLAYRTTPEPLTSTGLDHDGWAAGWTEWDGRNGRGFRVRVTDVPRGTYRLWVDDAMKAEFVVEQEQFMDVGRVDFAFQLPELVGARRLDFDPRGKLLRIKRNGQTYFSHVFGVGATNGAYAAPFRIDLPLFSYGQGADWSNPPRVDVTYSQDDRGRRHFHIVYVNVPDRGTYTLFVGGTQRGTLTFSNGGANFGTLTFEDYPEPDELPLDFNPLGQFIELKRDGVTYFARAFPNTD